MPVTIIEEITKQVEMSDEVLFDQFQSHLQELIAEDHIDELTKTTCFQLAYFMTETLKSYFELIKRRDERIRTTPESRIEMKWW